ncbi:MAG: hypothetical protein ACHQC8_02410 [Solirubrobacterales bacterium]
MALALPELERKLPYTDPARIFLMFKARLNQFRERNYLYSTLLKYYGGKQSHGTKALHEVLGSTSTGRPLIRDLGVAFEIQRKYVSNRMAPIVEDYQALVGRMPSIRVEPPDPGDQGREKAEKQTKYLHSTYDEVDMDHQQAFAGFCLSALGDACYILDIDPDSYRVLPSATLPLQCLPSFKRGPYKFELWDMITYSRWEYDEIVRELSFIPKSDSDEDCMVITYLSPFQRTILVGSEQHYAVVGDCSWDIGFCPAVWLRNKVTMDSAGSDIWPVLALQDMYDFTLNVMADGLVEMTYPMRMIRGAITRGDGPVEYGPGSNVEVGPEGDLKVVALAPPPQAGMMFAQTVIEDMNIGAGTTEVRQSGMPDRSNISGKAIHAAQGPQATRIDLKQILLAEALVKLNMRIMALQEKAPLIGKKKLELHGMYKATAFRIDFIPVLDINGWYLNTATFDELVGVTRQTRIQMAGQLRQLKLADSQYAMELAGIDDPLQMKKRIEAEDKEQARLAQETQGGGPGTSPPGGAPPGGAGAPPAFQHPAGVPQMPFRPPTTGAAGAPGGEPGALPGGVPQGASRDAVKKALEAIAGDLRGTVFAIGELAVTGQAQHIQLRISDPRDFRAVREAVAHLDPKVEVRFTPEDKMPPEKVRIA